MHNLLRDTKRRKMRSRIKSIFFFLLVLGIFGGVFYGGFLFFFQEESSEKSAYDTGLEKFSEGNFEESIVLLENAKKEIEGEDVYMKLAVSYYNEKKYSQARENYEKVLEMQPENALVYNGIANTYRDEKNVEEAENFYKKALAFNETYSPAYANWAIMYLDLGQTQKAREIVEEGLSRIPDAQELKNIKSIF